MRFFFLIFAVSTCFFQVHAQPDTGTYEADSIAVRAILDSLGHRQVSVDSVTDSLGGRIISLSMNSMFIDAMPVQLGMLTGLEVLTLRNNYLTRVPLEITKLTRLERLDLSDNRIFALPGEIGNLSALGFFVLTNNQLASLPPEIGMLSSLTTLKMENNKLTTLPSEIGQLSQLNDLRAANNELCSLPPEIVDLNLFDAFSIDSNKLCDLTDTVVINWLDSMDGYHGLNWQETQICSTSRAIEPSYSKFFRENIQIIPVHHGVNIRITPELPDQAFDIRIHDIHGRFVKAFYSITSGNRIHWSADRFGAGIYLVRASCNRYSYSKKILIMK
jgi:hypothetical protein